MSKFTDQQLDNWFSYHAPEGTDATKYAEIRAAGGAFARALVERCPPSADLSSAVRKIREAVFAANASIACKGQ